MNPWRDPPQPGEAFVLRDATVPAALLDDASNGDTALVDIGVADGVIQFVAPAQHQTETSWRDLSLASAMAWPCFVDLHAHLDSTQTWARSPNPTGDVFGAAPTIIADSAQYWTPNDMRTRMTFGLRCAEAHGMRAIRTHLASQNDQVDARWEVFRSVQAEWAGRIDLQPVSLISTEALRNKECLETVCALVQRSDGVLGAFAPMTPDLDDILDQIFVAANRYDLALDFHADETSDPTSNVLSRIAAAAIKHGFRRPIVVGHCCSLAVQDETEADRTLDLVAAAGIAVTALPACNLYLQSRSPGRTPRWRGVTLLHEMQARGIKVAIGGDNCRDPFHAYGDYDMLEVFRDAVRIAHLDHPIRGWPRAVTSTPADIIGMPHGRIAAGQAADIVLFKARTFNELLARSQSDRLIIRDGRFITPALPDYAELDELMPGRAERSSL